MLLLMTYLTNYNYFSVFLALLPKTHISEVVVLGAEKVKKNPNQTKQLINGVPIIISTPAPLNHKLKQGVLR